MISACLSICATQFEKSSEHPEIKACDGKGSGLESCADERGQIQPFLFLVAIPPISHMWVSSHSRADCRKATRMDGADPIMPPSVILRARLTRHLAPDNGQENIQYSSPDPFCCTKELGAAHYKAFLTGGRRLKREVRARTCGCALAGTDNP